jgi:probable HAF family extracellular repeat protein
MFQIMEVSMKSTVLMIVLGILIIAFPVLAQENPFDSQYTMTTWDHPGPINTVLLGINDSEQIVGYTHYNFDLATLSTFLKEGDDFTDFGVDIPGFLPTLATGINNLGQIVGYYLQRDSLGRPQLNLTRGFLFDKATFSYFNVPDAQWTTPSGINDSGQIVGFYGDLSASTHGFLYDGTTFTTFNVPGAQHTFPYKINGLGEIVGTYMDNSFKYHGFVYDGTAFTTFNVPGAQSTTASGNNDLGQIVGSYNDSSGTHAFLYDGTTFTTYNVPGAQWTSFMGINNLSEIVGTYQYSSGNSHGLIATPLSPGSQLEELIGDIEDQVDTGALTLTPNQADGLLEKLYAAIDSLDRERPVDAINQLHAFINQVNAFIKARKLTPLDGQELIDVAKSIIEQIES